jgi:uncharacterized protein (DUF2236 family)
LLLDLPEFYSQYTLEVWQMYVTVFNRTMAVPRPLRRRVEEAARTFLEPDDGLAAEFGKPVGEPSLLPPASISWQIFKNPVALFIGGVTAVILELAEPRVRTGVWEHSRFRTNPVRRLRRTGLAAMITVYGARSVAEAMIARVNRMHDRVTGTTPCGAAYRAKDPDLLNWVHVTAAFGFLTAYHTYVRPLSQADRDRYYAESSSSSPLYGVTRAASSEAEVHAFFMAMRNSLQSSEIIFEFLDIMRDAPVLPPLLRPAQRSLVRAAIGLTPPWAREIIGLGSEHGVRSWEAALIRQAGAAASHIVLESSPAVQACRRLGLPDDYLFRSRSF